MSAGVGLASNTNTPQQNQQHMQWKDFRDFTLTLHVPPEPPGLVSDLCGYIGTQSGSCCYGPTVRYSTVGLHPETLWFFICCNSSSTYWCGKLWCDQWELMVKGLAVMIKNITIYVIIIWIIYMRLIKRYVTHVIWTRGWECADRSLRKSWINLKYESIWVLSKSV